MEMGGVEPPACALRTHRSDHLSYIPICVHDNATEARIQEENEGVGNGSVGGGMNRGGRRERRGTAGRVNKVFRIVLSIPLTCRNDCVFLRRLRPVGEEMYRIQKSS